MECLPRLGGDCVHKWIWRYVDKFYQAYIFTISVRNNQIVLGPYYKSKLELKSNSCEILRVNCKFICDSVPTKTEKTQT